MNKQFKPRPNTFKKTFCIFQEVEQIEIENLQISYKSDAGSTYFYTEKGMFRLSNHWGKLANSKWRLVPLEIEKLSKFKLGFAKWENFYPDNDLDAIYYLEFNEAQNTINYNHIKNPKYDGKSILRTTFDTRKRIKQARNILNLSNWAKYYQTDIGSLRKQIMNEIIFTNQTLDEIKRHLL